MFDFELIPDLRFFFGRKSHIDQKKSSKEIRLKDHLVLTKTEKALESSAQGAAVSITVYSIGMIVADIIISNINSYDSDYFKGKFLT